MIIAIRETPNGTGDTIDLLWLSIDGTHHWQTHDAQSLQRLAISVGRSGKIAAITQLLRLVTPSNSDVLPDIDRIKSHRAKI